MIVVDRDVAMTTRDGVRLVADVYRPDDSERHPVLLHRTAYGKQTTAMIVDLIADPARLAEHGYAVVVQDVRGRYASEGRWVPFVHEAADGYDTVEWAAAQPWSNGRVGAYGSSYMGITAYQALLADPPHLEAVATVVSGCDLNDGLARTGGAFELGFVSLWSSQTALDTIGREPDDARRAELGAVVSGAFADPWAVVRTLPVGDAAPAQLNGWLADWVDHGPADPFYAPTTVHASDVRVPLLQVVGFRDWMQRSMLRLFRELPVEDRFALEAGPWTHGSAYGGPSGLRDWTSAAPGGPSAHTPRLLGWFDRWLTDEPRDAPRVRWFATGDEQWRTADTWPPPGRDVTLFLGAGTLDAQPAADAATSWRHDPDDPVPTCGGMIAMPLFGPDGVQDRTEVEARDDVAVWTGPELTEPLRIAGDVRVTVTLTADAPDADLVAVLVDVTPEGVAEPVTEGVQRLRHRPGTSEAWLEPGVPVEVTVALADTAHTLLPGHRLRLELAGSNFPRFSRTSGSREVPERAAALHPVTLGVTDGRLTLHTT